METSRIIAGALCGTGIAAAFIAYKHIQHTHFIARAEAIKEAVEFAKARVTETEAMLRIMLEPHATPFIAEQLIQNGVISEAKMKTVIDVNNDPYKMYSVQGICGTSELLHMQKREYARALTAMQTLVNEMPPYTRAYWKHKNK